MKKLIEKNCKNCKHYKQHYAYVLYEFKPINCGHCVNDEMSQSARNKIVDKLLPCAYWEGKEDESLSNIKKIEIELRYLKKKIDTIEYLLKNEITHFD